MRKTIYAFLAAALFFSSASFALANISYNPGAPTAPQPTFGFYCNPYSAAFTSGGYYMPTDGGVCTFELPQAQMASSSIFVAIYKGTPGNATLVDYDYTTLPPASVVQDSPDYFNGSQGENFFSVAIGYDNFNDVLSENNYLTSGGTDPDVPYSIVQWQWGAAPTSPLTVTADDKTIEFGSPLPALTATLSGFVNGDTASSSDVIGSAACTTTATASSTPGSYPITCAQGTLSSQNYTFSTFVPGTLTIVDTTAPSVTITTPANGSSYMQNASVVAAATISDLSPIATTTYLFDGKAINPANPLPLSSVAIGTSTLVVSATDKYGNTGYATSTFGVTAVPPPVVDHTPPTITITTPQQNGVYAKTDTVYLSANVSDQSPIATTTYWFNNKKINPAQPLPLSSVSTPSIQSVSVSATDKYGNTATSTTSFYVVKSTNSCLTDIISVLTLIAQDKTLPSKPTIVQLISDCSALAKGQHRGY